LAIPIFMGSIARFRPGSKNPRSGYVDSK
jgi:hypothetical protein